MKKSEAFYRAFPIVWIITILGGVVLFVFTERPWALGFILGNITSLFMMSMLNKNSYKVVESKSVVAAQKVAVRGYAFRFFFYAVILIVAGFHPAFEIVTTAVGLFVFKIVLYILGFIDSRGEVNNG